MKTYHEDIKVVDGTAMRTRRRSRYGWRMRAGGIAFTALLAAGCSEAATANTANTTKATQGAPGAAGSPTPKAKSGDRPTTAASSPKPKETTKTPSTEVSPTGSASTPASGAPNFNATPVEKALCTPSMVDAVQQAMAARYFDTESGDVKVTQCGPGAGGQGVVSDTVMTISYSENGVPGSVPYEIKVIKDPAIQIPGLDMPPNTPNSLYGMHLMALTAGVGDAMAEINLGGSSEFVALTASDSGDFTGDQDLYTPHGEAAINDDVNVLGLALRAVF